MATAIARPAPTDRSPVYTPFFEGLREGRILVQQCTACRTVFWPAREMCSECHATTFDWIETGTEGLVYTFSVFYRSFHPAFADRVPYATVSATTDRGVIVFGEYGGGDVESLAIGDRVVAEFFDGGAGFSLLRWVPITTADERDED